MQFTVIVYSYWHWEYTEEAFRLEFERATLDEARAFAKETAAGRYYDLIVHGSIPCRVV